jgi:hypothetical protein
MEKMGDPILKVTKAKKSWVMVQVVKCLHNKCKALSSDPSVAKKRRKERRKKQFQ